MEALIAADIMSSIFLGIIITGSFIGWSSLSKSSIAFTWVCLIGIVCCLTDAACYFPFSFYIPDFILYVIWIISYSFGTLAMVVFFYYSYLFLNEKTTISKWYFYVPMIILSLVTVYIIIVGITGGIVVIGNGKAVITGGMPKIASVIQIIFILYLPVLFLCRRKIIGVISIIFVGTFGIFPLITTIVTVITKGTDFSYPAAAVSVGIVYMLMESSNKNDAERKKDKILKRKNKELEENLAVIKSMSSIYFASYYIDLKKDTFIELSSKDSIRQEINTQGKAQQALWIACEKLMTPESCEPMKKFLDLSTINERMKDRVCISNRYIGVTTGWSLAYLIAGDRDSEGNLRHIFYAARTIHDEKQKEELQNKLLEEAYDKIAQGLGIIDGLSHEYHTIWLVDKDTGRMKLVRFSDESLLNQLTEADKNNLFLTDTMKLYAEKFVDSKDKERFISSINFKEIVKKVEAGELYTINYLRHDINGIIGHHQIAFANADWKDGVKQFVLGFRNVDEIVKEEQRVKQELQEARQSAEDANMAKTSFLFNMSHDIRTPMNAIIGFSDLLKKNLDNPEKRSDYLQKIQSSSKVLLSIINNVLEMARIEKGTIEIQETAWGASQFNDTLFSIFQELMKQKNIEFTRSIDVQHKYVFCDDIKLKEIYINILSNAYKYTESGGKVSMDLKEISSDKPGYAMYQTTITDTGIGMSEDFVPHLFEEFSREQNSTDAKIEGTGLGMSIVKRLVELMDGTIEVKSKKGAGTTFTVTIPHKISEELDLGHDGEIKINSGLFINKRILLVEDNELNAEIAKEILEDMGLSVERAENGQICLDMINSVETGYYNVVLMDIQMPVMNGYEATKNIRKMKNKEKADIPILAMTANAFDEDRREAIKAGMDGHIAKPIDVSILKREVARLLCKRLISTP